jgi:hypothetical protein
MADDAATRISSRSLRWRSKLGFGLVGLGEYEFGGF